MTDLFSDIATQRRQIADTLEQFTPDQWSTPSLCQGWTIQEVADHLTAGWNIGVSRFALRMIRAGGRFARANQRFGHRLGARPPEEIIADLRANANHRFTPPGSGPEAPLTDCIIHAQDMLVPIDIHYQTRLTQSYLESTAPITVDPAPILDQRAQTRSPEASSSTGSEHRAFGRFRRTHS